MLKQSRQRFLKIFGQAEWPGVSRPNGRRPGEHWRLDQYRIHLDYNEFVDILTYSVGTRMMRNGTGIEVR
jgi:hypothetical protein